MNLKYYQINRPFFTLGQKLLHTKNKDIFNLSYKNEEKFLTVFFSYQVLDPVRKKNLMFNDISSNSVQYIFQHKDEFCFHGHKATHTHTHICVQVINISQLCFIIYIHTMNREEMSMLLLVDKINENAGKYFFFFFYYLLGGAGNSQPN